MTGMNRLLAIAVFTGWASSVSAVPITAADIVNVDGTEWVQVDLFTSLSWNDIEAACPGGVCSGQLNGYSMGDLLWASVEELNVLFNKLLAGEGVAEANFLVGNDAYVESDHAPWVTSVFDAGFRKVITGGFGSADSIRGFTSDLAAPGSAYLAGWEDWHHPQASDFVFTDLPVDTDDGSILWGGWFYRSPDAPSLSIPAPATLGLLGLALVGLGWTRRKKNVDK